MKDFLKWVYCIGIPMTLVYHGPSIWNYLMSRKEKDRTQIERREKLREKIIEGMRVEKTESKKYILTLLKQYKYAIETYNFDDKVKNIKKIEFDVVINKPLFYNFHSNAFGNAYSTHVRAWESLVKWQEESNIFNSFSKERQAEYQEIKNNIKNTYQEVLKCAEKCYGIDTSEFNIEII